jgi:YhhN-like protein.
MTTAIILLLLFGCAAETAFIVFEHRKKMLSALLLKALASLLFVLGGVFAFSLAARLNFARLVIVGLMLGAIGDVCLNLRFLITDGAKHAFLLGIASFLLGHIAYVLALITCAPVAILYALPAAAVVSFFLIRFVLSRIEVDGAIKTFGIVYLCVVFFMACVALALFLSEPQNTGRAIFALGGVLFAASDVFLVLGQFGKRTYRGFRALNLSLYYVGQVCICLTIALMH